MCMFVETRKGGVGGKNRERDGGKVQSHLIKRKVKSMRKNDRQTGRYKDIQSLKTKDSREDEKEVEKNNNKQIKKKQQRKHLLIMESCNIIAV